MVGSFQLFIGGFGGQEVLFILAIALVVFGPKRIPSLARSLGKVSAQIRAANRQIQREIYSNLDPEEIMGGREVAPRTKRSPGAVARDREAPPPPPRPGRDPYEEMDSGPPEATDGGEAEATKKPATD